MTDTGCPNRYGREGFMLGGDLCCRHEVVLYKVCDQCNELLAKITESDDAELPTLTGTGDVVAFDEDQPLAELYALQGKPEDDGPDAGGSIRG